jgi:hypothetical protein
MTALSIASLAFGSIMAGALIGLALGSRLPKHHVTADTKDVVRLSMAMVATLTALVLGLVTASAKSVFDGEDAAIRTTAASVLSLDRMLADYGPQTGPLRTLIRTALMQRLAQTWEGVDVASSAIEVSGAPPSELIVRQVLALTPQTDAQQWYKARALELSNEILQSRWVVFGGIAPSVPPMFLVVIICWLSVLFGSFGLYAPRNATVIGALLICGLSVSASIFLILEMNTPFSGVMRVSSAPMQYALAHIDQ